MQRDVPPYRADHVGSILRSAPLKEARSKRAAGQLSAADLEAIEDAEIKKVIAKQEEVGLRSVTDGEFRRAYWHFDFLSGLDGVEMVGASHGIQFTGVQSKAEAPFVKGKLGSRHHPQIAHFEFLKANTKTHAQDDDSEPLDAALSRRAEHDRQVGLSDHGRVLSRSRTGL